jgi:hypothetical protein
MIYGLTKPFKDFCNNPVKLTYIDLHALDWERLDLRDLVRHVSVELVPALVPLDAVQGVAAEVVAARQVGRLALLKKLRDPHGQVRQAVDH